MTANYTTYKKARTAWGHGHVVLDGCPSDMLFCPLCEKHIENLLQHLRERHE